MKTENLVKEIKTYLPFAVPEADQASAAELVEKYGNDEIVLRLLRDYYTALPDAFEEAVTRVSEFSFKRDVHFIVLTTTGHSWLYAVTVDSVALIGEYGVEVPGEVPPEVMRFLGWSTLKEFHENCPPVEKLEEYPWEDIVHTHCPVCGVPVGEEHLLGCVVEVCPWCKGQLKSCNCRFEKLDVEEIETAEQVEAFADLLAEKGRIPFSPEQAPAYPGTSRGLDEGDKKS